MRATGSTAASAHHCPTFGECWCETMICLCNPYAETGPVPREPHCPIHGIAANPEAWDRPPRFLIAVINAIGEISKEEALAAIEKHWGRLRRGLEP